MSTVYDDEDNAIDEPIGRSIRRVFAQSDLSWFSPLVPGLAAGWLAYYLVARHAAIDDWKPILAVFVGVIAASWSGILGVSSRTPSRVRRHSSHFIGVVMLGISICTTLGMALGSLALALR